MIIDARKPGNYCWTVYDAKRCQSVKNVVWVNDETAQWAGYIKPYVVVGHDLLLTIQQEDRITIYPEKRLVIFNEIETEEPATEVGVIGAAT